MFDLEHDNVKHAHNFLHPCSIGIFLFLIKDVTNPSPRLLLANPREYLARVKRNAGAAQLMMFLLHVGIPVLSWQRMVRGADTAKIPKIRAYAWHLVRQQPPRTHAPPARRGTARLPHTARTPRSTACGAGTLRWDSLLRTPACAAAAIATCVCAVCTVPLAEPSHQNGVHWSHCHGRVVLQPPCRAAGCARNEHRQRLRSLWRRYRAGSCRGVEEQVSPDDTHTCTSNPHS